MRIKLAALFLCVADIVLFMLASYMLAKVPGKGAPHNLQVAFVVRSYIVVLLLLASLFTTVMLVWIWATRVREEYREQSRENLETLIEGTLRDHEH